LVQAQQLSLSTMRCAPSRTAKEALRAASAIADAIAFAIGQPPEVDVNEIIVRPGRKHVLITRSRLPERPVDRKRAAQLRPFFVELPGIEPATETALTCGKAENDYAKRRQTT
jgi:hypothetical protein